MEEYQMIGSYKIIDVIAETGYSRLYRVQDQAGNELAYAVKEYTKDIPGISTDQLLEREKSITQHIKMKAGKRIVEPILNVTIGNGGQQNLYDQREGDRTYALMTYENTGMFLSELVKKIDPVQLSEKFTLGLLEAIVKCLETLHSFEEDGSGYLHLDIHPGNIFFENVDLKKEEPGTAKLIDFASAVRVGKDGKAMCGEHTQVFALTGFSSPELEEGEAGKLCRASDLYSAAAVFRWLWKKRKPSNPIMEAAVSRFLDVCMNYNPHYRYASAKEMQKGIDRLKSLSDACENLRYYDILAWSYSLMISGIDDKIRGFGCPEKFSNYSEIELKHSAEKLEEDLKKDIVDIERSIYIFSGLFALAQQVWDEPDANGKARLSKDTKNALLASGVVCWNREGKGDILEKLEEGPYESDVMKCINLRNRIAEVYADKYQFAQAYEMVEGNVRQLEDLRRNIAKTPGVDPEMIRSKELGRAYSARGRYLAMAGKDTGELSKSSMEFFKRALDSFDDEDIGNRRITISHILNYACDTGDKNFYEEYSGEYFEAAKTVSERLEQILKGDEEGILDPYALYTFLKCTYVFEKEIGKDTISLISGLLMEPRVNNLNYNPVQLIYKYVALILLENNEGKVTKDIEKAMNLSLNKIEMSRIDINKTLNIYMLMAYQTKAIYCDKLNKFSEKDELSSQLQKHAEKDGWEELSKALKDGTDITQILKLGYC